MTEVEWNACTDPAPMFIFLRHQRDVVSDRKVRLFVCEYARLEQWDDFGEAGREIIEIGEGYADGTVTEAEVEKGRRLAIKVRNAHEGSEGHPWYTVVFALSPAIVTTGVMPVFGHYDHHGWIRNLERASTIARDIFGPLPFRPVTLDPSWLASPIPQLAESIYSDRAFDRLPILADALEEGGCTNADILTHCRQPGDHVRGCWVIDLLLGKK